MFVNKAKRSLMEKKINLLSWVKKRYTMDFVWLSFWFRYILVVIPINISFNRLKIITVSVWQLTVKTEHIILARNQTHLQSISHRNRQKVDAYLILAHKLSGPYWRKYTRIMQIRGLSGALDDITTMITHKRIYMYPVPILFKNLNIDSRKLCQLCVMLLAHNYLILLFHSSAGWLAWQITSRLLSYIYNIISWQRFAVLYNIWQFFRCSCCITINSQN